MADSVDVILYTITDDAKKVDKSLGTGSTQTCTFRGPVDVVNPSFSISSSDNLSNINYAYISRYGRYYFIERPTVGPNGMWHFQGHSDVLMSRKDAIRNLAGTITRSETGYNGYLNDPNYQALAYRQTVTKGFPNAMDDDTFILITVG